jgi:hypothetical protein
MIGMVYRARGQGAKSLSMKGKARRWDSQPSLTLESLNLQAVRGNHSESATFLTPRTLPETPHSLLGTQSPRLYGCSPSLVLQWPFQSSQSLLA